MIRRNYNDYPLPPGWKLGQWVRINQNYLNKQRRPSHTNIGKVGRIKRVVSPHAVEIVMEHTGSTMIMGYVNLDRVADSAQGVLSRNAPPVDGE